MAPNWSEPSIKHERIDINPYELVELAEKHAESGDYHSAEGTYITAIKAARGTASQADIVKKGMHGLAQLYDSWASFCFNNHRFEDAEHVLNKALKVNSNKAAVKSDFRLLYITWGDRLCFEGKLQGAESRYIRALQINSELDNNYATYISLIRKIKEIKYMYKSLAEKRLAHSLYIIEQGKGYKIKALFLGILGALFTYLSILFRGNEDIFWTVLAIMFLSPIAVRCYSFNYERLAARRKLLIPLLYMFFWTIVGGLCCAKDPLYAFYPAIVGIYCILFAIKMIMTNVKKLSSKIINQLLSRAEAKGDIDIKVTHTVEDEKKAMLKQEVNRTAAMGVRLLFKMLFG